MQLTTQVTVISPMGTFIGDQKEVDLTLKQLEEAQEFFENCYQMDYLAIDRGDEKIYFPAEIIHNSIVIFHVTERK